MNLRERPVRISCDDAVMVGLIHEADPDQKTGVLIIVGGPQVRTGSHRQFTLLSRHIAQAGLPVMRFDCMGKGDSSGTFADFDQIDDDIRAAIDHFLTACPKLEQVILWGLCDGASAGLFYAHKDPRVAGIIFANPWVRTEAGEAKAYLKHYYLQRLASGELWRKVFTGQFAIASSLKSLLGFAGQAYSAGRKDGSKEGPTVAQSPDFDHLPLPEKLAAHFQLYEGPALLILSGNDLTAKEFEDCVAASDRWPTLLNRERVSTRKLEASDHTFSRRVWRDEIAGWTVDWIKETGLAA